MNKLEKDRTAANIVLNLHSSNPSKRIAEYMKLPRLTRLQFTRETLSELANENPDNHGYIELIQAVDRRIAEVQNGTAPAEKD